MQPGELTCQSPPKVVRDLDDQEHLVRARQGQRVEIVPRLDERQIRLRLGVLPEDDRVLDRHDETRPGGADEQGVELLDDGRVPAPNVPWR